MRRPSTDSEIQDFIREDTEYKQKYAPDPSIPQNPITALNGDEFKIIEGWPTDDIPDKINNIAFLCLQYGGLEAYVRYKATYLGKTPKQLVDEYEEIKRKAGINGK